MLPYNLPCLPGVLRNFLVHEPNRLCRSLSVLHPQDCMRTSRNAQHTGLECLNWPISLSHYTMSSLIQQIHSISTIAYLAFAKCSEVRYSSLNPKNASHVVGVLKTSNKLTSPQGITAHTYEMCAGTRQGRS